MRRVVWLSLVALGLVLVGAGVGQVDGPVAGVTSAATATEDAVVDHLGVAPTAAVAVVASSARPLRVAAAVPLLLVAVALVLLAGAGTTTGHAHARVPATRPPRRLTRWHARLVGAPPALVRV